MNKCKDCFCNCHCNVKEHSDSNGVCHCKKCNCNPQGITVNNDECLSCQQTQKKTCNTHTKEKEKSGTCCQVGNVKENAEQLTYEHHADVGPAPKEQNE